MTDDVDDLKQKRICSECVGEEFLRDEIDRFGDEGRCDYCGQEAPTFSIEEMADRIETAFEQHYERTDAEPSAFEWAMIKDKEIDYDWEREGDRTVDAISEAAQIDEEPASDIQAVLDHRYSDWHSLKAGEETEFASDAQYARKGPNDALLQADWNRFEHLLKTETRFFSREAAATLEGIFKDISHLKTRKGHSVVVSAGPGTAYTSFYRARAFESDAELEDALMYPELRLGPPPPNRAKDGRMNARGIAVFYGAGDPMVALAEVRPPVGSKVLVGRFEILRPLHLLDLKALQEVGVSGSIFDPTYIQRLERAKFLERLSRRITIPVMPTDEPFEYLATQAIADFLATEANPPLDGIIFPSVQAGNGQYNVVLFHKAARVQVSDLPQGSTVTAQLYHDTEDGPETSYWVWEEVPPPPEKVEPDRSKPELITFRPTVWTSPSVDDRAPALKLDTASLAVHHVQRVVYTTEQHEVTRHRMVRRDGEPDF